MQKNFESNVDFTEQTILRSDIVEMLKASKNRDSPAVLSPKSIQVSFFCNLLNVTDDFVYLKNPIPPELAKLVLSSTEVGLYCGTYWLTAPSVFAFGTNIKFPIPETAIYGQSRNADRIYFSQKEQARVEIQHPFDPKCILNRKIFDMSPGGLSFRAIHQTAFLQPGRILPMLRVYLGDELKTESAGKIVYIKQIIDLNGRDYFQVGVQFIEFQNPNEDTDETDDA
jgi:hypothetical protein